MAVTGVRTAPVVMSGIWGLGRHSDDIAQTTLVIHSRKWNVHRSSRKRLVCCWCGAKLGIDFLACEKGLRKEDRVIVGGMHAIPGQRVDAEP